MLPAGQLQPNCDYLFQCIASFDPPPQIMGPLTQGGPGLDYAYSSVSFSVASTVTAGTVSVQSDGSGAAAANDGAAVVVSVEEGAQVTMAATGFTAVAEELPLRYDVCAPLLVRFGVNPCLPHSLLSGSLICSILPLDQRILSFAGRALCISSASHSLPQITQSIHLLTATRSWLQNALLCVCIVCLARSGKSLKCSFPPNNTD